MTVEDTTPLYIIAELGDLERFKNNYDTSMLNTKTPYGASLLHCAIEGRNYDIAKFLLDAGIDVKTIDEDGKTPLHWICVNQDLEIAQIILEKGVDINTRDIYGNPAIWTAAFNSKGRNYDMVELLMKYNPDITIKNNAGLTAIDLALRFDDPKLYDMLSTLK